MTRLTVPLCTALIVTLVAAGCSSSGSGTPATGHRSGSQVAAHPSSAASDTHTTPATSTGTATCKQLTAADVQALQVDKIIRVRVIDNAPSYGKGTQQCLFDVADASGSLAVLVASGQLASSLYATDTSSASKAVSVPGVGDKAFRDADSDSPALSAMHAGEYCHVDTSDPGSVPGADRLYVANGHHANIGDAAFAILAAALGTVCNRVFGSGSTTPDLRALAAVPASSGPSDDGLPTSFQMPTDGATH